jgi:Uma2 family endonuclease
MSAAQPLTWPHIPEPTRRYTEAEYLAFDERAEGRWEYFDGKITPVGEPGMVNQLDPTFMAGASSTHYRLASTLLRALFAKLKNGCQPFASDARVHIPLTGGYAYPDVVIVCGELKFQNPDEPLPSLANPAIIVEILSESTAEFDRFGKFARYRSISSLQQYIMLDSRRPQVEVLTRQTGDAWLYEALNMPADVIHLAAGECILTLAELYEGLLPFPIEAER